MGAVAEAHGVLGAVDQEAGRGAVGLRDERDVEVGAVGVPHRRTRGPRAASSSATAASTRVVDVHHRDARPLEDLGLRAHDRVDRPEALEVHGSDGGEHRDLRRQPLAQRADLALGVHAHLGDEDLGAGLEVLVDRRARPSRLLKLAGLATTTYRSPSRSRMCSLVDVLPYEPVTATTRGRTLSSLVRASLDVPVAEPGFDRGEDRRRDVDDEREHERDDGGTRPAATRRPPSTAATHGEQPVRDDGEGAQPARERELARYGRGSGRPERPQHDRDRAHEQHRAPDGAGDRGREQQEAEGDVAGTGAQPAQPEAGHAPGQVVLTLRDAQPPRDAARGDAREQDDRRDEVQRGAPASSARHADAIASGCVNGRS